MNRTIKRILPMCEFVMKFDGCSKGNPGHSGAGAVIYCNNTEIWGGHKYIGHFKTNNEAEYSGLILGLQKANELNIDTLLVCGDSQIVINQMRKEYKVKSVKLLDLHREADELSKTFTNIMFEHIYRGENTRADHLSNLAVIDLFKYENNKHRN
jgi:ribonuclease HI